MNETESHCRLSRQCKLWWTSNIMQLHVPLKTLASYLVISLLNQSIRVSGKGHQLSTSRQRWKNTWHSFFSSAEKITLYLYRQTDMKGSRSHHSKHDAEGRTHWLDRWYIHLISAEEKQKSHPICQAAFVACDMERLSEQRHAWLSLVLPFSPAKLTSQNKGPLNNIIYLCSSN